MAVEIGYYDAHNAVKVMQTEETYEQAKRVLHTVNEYEIANQRPLKFGIVSWIEDSNYGPDQVAHSILFDPRSTDDKRTASWLFYNAICVLSRSLGENPDNSVQYLNKYDDYPRIVWESGPYEWGIVASSNFLFNREAGWYTEPYNSFDVCFTE